MTSVTSLHGSNVHVQSLTPVHLPPSSTDLLGNHQSFRISNISFQIVIIRD
ncbi:hypothetical protein CERSUDRAFT_101436 [Gelatoporia subvermispora B]|uniref:Uncharacterized protein n=1 Tax=Ceriporiopsis subvermispora (strain B) TaxID=914234 RepID=M2QEF1_CERS8|nr:hypothetical protein CERSUDRAFT_101436 [Gelatoporia subvermispora B]